MKWCIEPECTKRAEHLTPWQPEGYPLWCTEHDEARRERISKQLEQLVADAGARAL